MVDLAAAPIQEALPALKSALASGNTAVLVAPPGAGKTTVVPLALMDEPWTKGRKIIVLEPRRLAARAAAARMAQTIGEPVGRKVGFRVRMQAEVSAATRIEVVTEGVFTRMILDDPGLEGVAAVLFDEFHERSLDADLGLALARDAQGVLRDDLRLLVMSATLDGARVAALLGGAPAIESQGRAYPVETRHIDRDPMQRLEDQVARAVRRALSEETGSILAFLPGQGEIRRAVDLLQDRLPPGVDLAPLYGALSPAEQDRAVGPAEAGRRKVVLATSIAETSLTIEGVRVVVDCGFARVPRYDPASGLTRLETVRVSRAAADQRRGRAGRTEAGVCYRLWNEAETRALVPYAPPEILESDLSGFALDLALWGAADAEALTFLDDPPKAAMAEAKALLTALGALDGAGRITAEGRRLSRLPLPPRLAHMVLKGAARGAAHRAAIVAVILTERGLGGGGADLHARVEAFARDRGRRAEDARTLAARWARQAEREAERQARGAPGETSDVSDGALLLAAYPERLAKRRGGAGEFRLASGRGVYVDPADALACADWLVVADLGSGGARDRILLAAALSEDELLAAASDRIETVEMVETDAGGRVKARRVRRIGVLVLDERDIAVDAAVIERALMQEALKRGVDALPWGAQTAAFRARVAFLRGLEGEPWPDLSDAALAARAEAWLPGALVGVRTLAAVRAEALDAALRTLIPWALQDRLDRLAPQRFTAPTGSSFVIDYAAEGGPRAEARVQELFGLSVHPTVAEGRVPLTLALTSPARRPIQVTQDLPGFWRGSWAEVKKDMRGRYPKHPWPDDPLSASPTTRAKPRG
jgi:ATP-dependent helicase HrpB